MTQIEWVRGFISAFNTYRSPTGNVTAGTDMDGVYAWIDNYCAAHPSTPFLRPLLRSSRSFRSGVSRKTQKGVCGLTVAQCFGHEKVFRQA